MTLEAPGVGEEVPAGLQLGRRILYERFQSIRNDIEARIARTGSAARGIPIVAGADVGAIGVYGLLFQSLPLGPLFVILAVTASILVTGFFACVESVAIVFDAISLADLEIRLGVPADSGYFLRDLAGHHRHRREPWIIEEWNRRALGVRLRNVWVRTAALLPLWAGAVTGAVGGVAILVTWSWTFLAWDVGAAIGVFLALTGIVRVGFGSLPSNVFDVLREPDPWFQKAYSPGGWPNGRP